MNQKQSTSKTTLDPPGTDNKETSEKVLNHIHCESAYDESENENRLDTNMLKIEHKYEIPIVSFQ